MGINGLQEALQLIAIVVTAITGAVGLLAGVRRWFRSTIGRRWVLARNLERLAPTMQMGYFVQVLGEPQQRSAADDGVQVTVWTMEDAFVQTLTDPSGMVTRLSVTTRNRRFTPTFYPGHTINSGDTLEVTLGATRFAELPASPLWVRGNVGPRRFYYDEGYYFGNPGNYQPFTYSLNDAGYVNDNALLSLMMHEHGLTSKDARDMHQLTGHADIAAARASTAINTITIGAPHTRIGPDEDPLGYGPNSDALRVFPDTLLRARWRSWRSALTARLSRWQHRIARSRR